MKIESVTLTPVAIPDLPLINTKGVHQDVFTRTVIEMHTDAGLTGISETYGARRTLDGLRRAAGTLAGLDPWHLNELRRRVDAALPNAGGINAATALTDHRLVDVVYSAFEVACLDLQGRACGRSISDLLGGAVREHVHFGGYLFYKFATSPGASAEDLFGEVMTPEALVEEAQAMATKHGFRSFKLKGGVLEPQLELQTMQLMREALPDAALRIDPMGAWSLPTALRMCDAMKEVLEYLEDPVCGLDGMAELASLTDVPLATNLVVVDLTQLFESLRRRAVDIVLTDHHYWGGVTGASRLGELCRAGGLGVSMHSNSHLGISLAAMVHAAACTPHLSYDCDTHYNWTCLDVIKGGRLTFRNGALAVPAGPGLGVEIDQDALTELNARYKRAAVRDRDDTREMRKYVPDYERKVPRW